jgi:hypothetical protein
MRRRLYKSGSRWALLRWTETDSAYLTRLFLVKTPWFCVCLHWILKPDPEPYLHDHPTTFLSLILRGGYSECRAKNGTMETEDHNWYNFIRATPDDAHSITNVKPNTLTLCFMGPKLRDWGYHLDYSWMHWKTYNDLKRAGIQP